MGINHTDSVAILDILNDHVEHEHRFTGTGFTENVYMLAPVFTLDAEKLILVTIGGLTKICDISIDRYFRQFHIALFYNKNTKTKRRVLLHAELYSLRLKY